jgi:hypothetical protein
MTLIKNIAIGIYGTGIVISSMIGIRQQNLRLDKRKKKGDTTIDYADYLINSCGGLMIGTYTGLFWPITVLGRALVMIFPDEKENIKIG